MSVALPIADPQRRGACPTLDAPMQTGDGLLARLRVANGRLTPTQLATVASLAAEHGNGQVEITARGNLQVRGLTPPSSAPFARAVQAAVAIERGLVVEVSPLAGDDPTERADPRPLAEAIRIAAEPLADRLGAKVTVIVDGDGQIPLKPLKADIRLVALDAARWSLALGGSKPQTVDTDAAIETAVAVLSALAALGPAARATDLFPASRVPPPLPSPPHQGEGAVPAQKAPSRHIADAAPPPLWGRLGGGTARLDLRQGHTVRITLPFGQMDAPALIALAQAATASGVETLRLAPGHALLLDDAPDHLVARAAALGFITDPTDPRTRVSACIGNQGCASGHLPARQVAARLAPLVPAGTTLHVSGCSKGCAHPRRAALTLVGGSAGIGLVIGGTAGDTPAMTLRDDQIESAIAQAFRPA